MTTIDIDLDSGAIMLLNGYAVSPALTQEAFRKGAMFSNAESRDYGTFPWIHYSFSGGTISDKNLLVSLCFFDQMLVYTTLCVDLYPPGPKDWSSYSLDVESATKEFHDATLKKILGNPTESNLLPNLNLDAAHTCLARPHNWVFKWGNVISSHDFKGGGTYITVNYGNRHEEATKAYWKKFPKKP